MRGIALKIFLSFWLIFAMLIAAFAVLPDDGAGVRFADHLKQHGIVAAGLLEREGAAACAAYVAATADRARVEMTLLDASGRTVCGQQPAGDATTSAIATANATFRVAGSPLPGFSDLRVWPPFPYFPLLLTIVVSGVVCFWMARSLARPLQDVRDASRRLADGDLQARAGADTAARRDEIGDMGQAFNTMAERIEALVNAQGQLLSDISHELRSPLARLNVALELARRKAGPAANADLLRIETEADRMNDLIERVLTLARAEYDDTVSSAEVFALVDVVRDVADDAKFEAAQQQKSVVLEVDAAPLASGRPALIASAVDNLVRNAVRHTPAGSTVHVVVRATADTAVIDVRDHGPGVPAAELERIFAPFHRVEAGRSPQSGGVGLGLAIARRAVAVHHGTIAATNAPDGGLRVTITLPRHLDATV